MGNLGFMELVVVAVIALVVFGPERLPELARHAGKALAKFRTEASRSIEDIKRAADLQGFDDEVRGIRDDVRGLRSTVTEAISGGSGTSATRPADRPPPTDPEAT